MKKETPYFHSIIISDIHLGTPDSKTKEVIEFLCATRCKTLILTATKGCTASPSGSGWVARYALPHDFT